MGYLGGIYIAPLICPVYETKLPRVAHEIVLTSVTLGSYILYICPRFLVVMSHRLVR